MPVLRAVSVISGTTLATLALAGCNTLFTGSTGSSSTMTTIVTATVTRVPGDPSRPGDSARFEWSSGASSQGLFAVGGRPDGPVPGIPPGRYAVKLIPDAAQGSWMLCDTLLCGLNYQDNAISSGYSGGPEWSVTLDVTPEATALWVYNLILTPV